VISPSVGIIKFFYKYFSNIFSLCKANITGIALATAKIFNAAERKKSAEICK
jgi:hypothetical protein